MKFLDADVRRPLASVSAIVVEGNVVVFGQHESFIENGSTGQRIPVCKKEWRVRDAIGHSTMSEDDEIREMQRGRCD